MENSKTTLAQDLLRGLAIGFVATQALDVVSILCYEGMSEKDRKAEDRVRGGHQAYEVAVKRGAKLLGKQLTEQQTKYLGWKFHRSFGLAGGLQYVMLRKMFPKIGKGLGLGFGVGFFLLADEVMIYLAGLTPGPTKFSWKAHARGALAHIAYGVAAELTARSFDRIHPYEVSEGPSKFEDAGKPTAQKNAIKRATPRRASTAVQSAFV